VIGPKQAEEVTDMVLNLQELPDIRDLTRLLMPSSERQISDEELNAKFLKLASETVRRQQAEVLLDRLWHIELASDIREVMTSGRS
jgi:hypothetical protein